jgi:hypothetical protein
VDEDCGKQDTAAEADEAGHHLLHPDHPPVLEISDLRTICDWS